LVDNFICFVTDLSLTCMVISRSKLV